MTPWLRSSTFAAFGMASLAGAHGAHAEVLAVHVRYSAPAGCSSRAAFVQELAQRTRRVRVVESTEPLPTLAVELADRGAKVLGELRLTETDGSETTRAVVGATCEEVVPALALIAAVLVDPEASSHAVSTASPPSPPPSQSTPAPRWRVRPNVAAGAALTSAVGPGLGLGPWLELGLETEHDGRRGPALGLAVSYFRNPTQTTAAGDADFSTQLGRLLLIPWRWPATGPVFGSACGAFELGSVRAAGTRTLGEHHYSELWLALDPVVELAYRPLPFLSLGLDGLLVFPLVRDSYYFGPDLPVFSVPAVAATGQVRLLAVWP
jgi:hypothetical protein